MQKCTSKPYQTESYNTLKGSWTIIKWDLYMECKDFFNICKSISVICFISKLKNWNHMIISIDAETLLTKFNTHLWLKSFQKVGIEETCLSIIKAICEKPRANIILNGEKLKELPLRSRTREGSTLLPLLLNIVLEVLAMAIRKEKEIKRIQVGKEAKFSLFSDDMILHIENTKDATRKLLELIEEFGKIVEYKINTGKFVAFLYFHNDRWEKEINETIPFIIALKRIK